MMKKVLSLLICLVLTLSISISVLAADTVSVNTSVSGSAVKLGDTVTVTVSISGGVPFKSMALTPSYDSSVFEMVEGSWLLSDAIMSSFDKVNAVVAYAEEVTKSGAVFQYVLKVKDAAALKGTSISTYAVIKNGETPVNSVAGGTSVKIICKEHNFGDWANNAESGKHERTCPDCGTVEASAHSWNSGKVTKEPTCKATGVKLLTCTVCKATTNATVAVTEDHTFGEWAQTKAPTCTEVGAEARTCSVCEKEETREVAVAEHTMGEWTVTKEATETEEGLKTSKCTACDFTKEEVIPCVVVEPTEPAPTEPADNGADNSRLAIILVAIAIVIICVIVIIVLVKKKKAGIAE